MWRRAPRLSPAAPRCAPAVFMTRAGKNIPSLHTPWGTPWIFTGIRACRGRLVVQTRQYLGQSDTSGSVSAHRLSACCLARYCSRASRASPSVRAGPPPAPRLYFQRRQPRSVSSAISGIIFLWGSQCAPPSFAPAAPVPPCNRFLAPTARFACRVARSAATTSPFRCRTRGGDVSTCLVLLAL